VLDNPSLVVSCIVGDGEAETGPLATSWHSAKFVNPATDGAVLPILHLNGGRIGTATVLSRIPETQLVSLFEGYGYKTFIVDGDYTDTKEMHQKMAGAMDACLADIAAIQAAARAGDSTQPVWPMIILRTRVVNVVDLFALSFPGVHEHALSEKDFESLFGESKTPVVFFYHGTPQTVHGFLYRRRSAAGRFGVHGYIEEGSTTTPFDLTVMNEASRYHLIIDALERVAAAKNQAPGDSEYYPIVRELKEKLVQHAAYIWEHGEDMPDIAGWSWD